jgi:hypothetical protein
MRAIVLPVVFVMSAGTPSTAALPHAATYHSVSGHAAEVARIRAHFDSVLAELPLRSTASLSDVQRARRGELISTLRAYRDRGEFPHNHDFPGEAVPYFVDRETGVLCAVAHLLATSGRRDIVDRVALTDNNVWVDSLATDAEFTDWLASHGLTLAEAARIQVPYMEEAPGSSIRAGESGSLNTGASLALGSAIFASVWNARANSAGSGRIGNALGIIAGAAALGIGGATLGDDGSSDALGAATIAAGAASAWLSTRGILRQRRVAAEKREDDRATVAPILSAGGKPGAGVSVTLRF